MRRRKESDVYIRARNILEISIFTMDSLIMRFSADLPYYEDAKLRSI